MSALHQALLAIMAFILFASGWSLTIAFALRIYNRGLIKINRSEEGIAAVALGFVWPVTFWVYLAFWLGRHKQVR